MGNNASAVNNNKQLKKHQHPVAKLEKQKHNNSHILKSTSEDEGIEQEAAVVKTVETSALMEEIGSNPAINALKNGKRGIGISHYLVQSRYKINNYRTPVKIQIQIVGNPTCICKQSLQQYKKDNIPSYSSDNAVICDICEKKTTLSNQFIYHCPNGKNATHSSGYDLCFHCGVNAIIQKTWNDGLKRAINIVNRTCPGVYIAYYPQHVDTEKIIEIYSKKNSAAGTWSNVRQKNRAIIELGTKRKVGRNGTALHELLHALGFVHEHKRADRNKFGVSLNLKNCKKKYGKEWEEWKYQYQKANGNDVHGITTYDPHSIMNYVNCRGQFDVDEKCMTSYHSNSPLKGDDRRDVLSPLDEIGLNLLYQPCKRDWYNPIKNTNTPCLYYCGRVGATVGHNYPGKDRTDGKCGPNNGANCAACRVLQNNDIPKTNDEGRIVWQGSSGYFYCGKYVRKQNSGHDGYCGPNNGASCSSCYKLIV